MYDFVRFFISLQSRFQNKLKTPKVRNLKKISSLEKIFTLLEIFSNLLKTKNPGSLNRQDKKISI